MKRVAHLLLVLGLWSTAAGAQVSVVQSRGIDSRVDYGALQAFGPWDDRNYRLTQEDLAVLADNEAELKVAVPVFFRVELRRSFDLLDEGPVQYPRSSLPRFLISYGGYLVDGSLYRSAVRADEGWRLVAESAFSIEMPREDLEAGKTIPTRFLVGESRVTSPVGAAESAIAINPVNTDIVIAGSNGPGAGQRMHFSSDGGATWTQAAALPLGGTCCDPTVDWSIDGTKGYTATLGSGVFIYRTGDMGATWDDLANEPGNDPRRELGGGVDKEFLHVDRVPTSPHADNIYLTWHQGNIMQFSRSTDFANTWSTPLAFAADDRGIGSDIATDTAGNVYYFYPAFNTQLIRLKKSTDGGASFAAQTTVAPTLGSFIFPVPSMETREVFIYVSADADVTDGAFKDSIYAAWTDSTGPTGGAAAANHARIQVAYSRDAGATWTATTPHETADANTVDRYHQWLKVAGDGSVHVIFYDTRQDPANRNAVDIYHSFSTDGAVTWSTPERLTTASSPNLPDGFEFGDYNGLDIVMSDLIAIYTDSRDESGGAAASEDVYAVGRLLAGSTIFADGFESGSTSAWSSTVP